MWEEFLLHEGRGFVPVMLFHANAIINFHADAGWCLVIMYISGHVYAYIKNWYPLPVYLPVEIEMIIIQFAFDPEVDPW